MSSPNRRPICARARSVAGITGSLLFIASSGCAADRVQSTSEHRGPEPRVELLERVQNSNGSVIVLGDSTSNDGDEWFALWAKSLGSQATPWEPSTAEYADGHQPARFRSASIPGGTASDVLNHWESIWPEENPIFALVNFGHNYESANEAREDLSDLGAKLKNESPETMVVVILQNPQRSDRNISVRLAVKEWAENEKLTTIDVAAAWADSGKEPDSLLLDEVHPNAEGQQIWLSTVEKALGTN